MSLLDLILRCDEAALINVLWTEDLLGELARTWFAKGVRSAAAAERICGHIRSAFVGQDISRAGTSHSSPECRAPIPTTVFIPLRRRLVPR